MTPRGDRAAAQLTNLRPVWYLRALAVVPLFSMRRVRALTPRASAFASRRLHTLLLLLVVTLGAGGSGVGVRTTEIAEGEGESQIRLEATHARRRAVHLEPHAQAGELEDPEVDPQGSPCRARRDPSDPKTPEYQFLGPPRPSRAPPPSA